MSSLSGKVAFVTGGARGQGRSHALALAEAGADVAICDIAQNIGSVRYDLGTADQLAETVALVEKYGRRAVAFEADVRDAVAVQEAVDSAAEHLGPIDIMLSNAGIFSRGTVAELSVTAWQDMIDVNLTGAFNALRAVIPGMVSRGSGRIVVTSSMAGKTGAPNMSHYVAAKWGVIGLVKSAALELAQTGVTVNAVCPTNVNSDMLKNADMYSLFVPGNADPTLEDALPVFRMTIPMGIPWVEPEEISKAILFLVGDSARYITGETISIAGGQSAMNTA